MQAFARECDLAFDPVAQPQRFGRHTFRQVFEQGGVAQVRQQWPAHQAPTVGAGEREGAVTGVGPGTNSVAVAEDAQGQRQRAVDHRAAGLRFTSTTPAATAASAIKSLGVIGSPSNVTPSSKPNTGVSNVNAASCVARKWRINQNHTR